ncbi:MAG: hypothetical protein WBX25_09695 [Rhodomicrobium sp.]
MTAIEMPSRPLRHSLRAKSGSTYLPRLRATLPISLTLTIATLFLPIELSFYLFGLRLTAIRFIFLLVAPYLFLKFAGKIAAGSYRFVLSDFFIICTGVWMIVATAKNDGIESALNHAGPEVLELVTAYFIARTLLREHGQAVMLMRRLCWAIAIIGLIGLLDPITGQYITKETAAQITGYPINFSEWQDAYRLGLLRASGPVDHPILLGFVCAIALLISASINMRGRWFILTASGLGLAATISSAPVQSAIMGFGLLRFARLTSGLRFRWLALFLLAALMVVATFLVSNSPLSFIISHLTFDPSTGYYRYWTWYQVLAYVPWYGHGYGTLPDDLNHSIDSLWLMLLIQAGYPGAILTSLSMIGAGSIRTSGDKVHLTAEERKLGTVLGIIVFLTIFLSFTVDLWNSTWILTGLLAGTRAHLGELGRLSHPPAETGDKSKYMHLPARSEDKAY